MTDQTLIDHEKRITTLEVQNQVNLQTLIGRLEALERQADQQKTIADQQRSTDEQMERQELRRLREFEQQIKADQVVKDIKGVR